ncbi:MAG TPA: HNH endonuclease [Chitinophagales bacterium]|nr:HNH endonuclease [Chitinophagales bacterium]HMW13515.1 HNH endonuclease [Chitinophagales bacterium]HMY22801.1 HNH endonuclease [Chitinophagales bacterium]HMZ34275.1 HNH endonuclease [Chitinophagales bacterium]HNF18603.1 HNH endonuclease [Chitinophagales bacterium]
MKIEEITFDSDDKNLFLIDDIQLKADAIRYSILPKLEVINNELISRITEMYDFDLFQNCAIGKTPQFRTSKSQRTKPVTLDYKHSIIWINGQRTKNKWKGLERINNKEAQITPTAIGIRLTTEGISSLFWFGYVKNFTEETYRKFYDFLDREIINVLSLLNRSGCKFQRWYFEIIDIRKTLQQKFENGDYNILIGQPKAFEYPINYEKINEIILSNLMLFPLFNAFLNISLGIEPNIKNDIEKAEKNFQSYYEKYFTEKQEETSVLSESDMQTFREKADNKIKVQAGIRWQVFKRDNWKCVACGRSAEENIILHIDHILPRSKGGKDEMNNYQTLCETCNIGKSNKDETDLRKK